MIERRIERRVRRSLFIGLGGTGCEAVLYCKKRFLEVCGEIPRAVGFLAIDTVPEPSQMTTSTGRPVRFDAMEYLRLQVTNPVALVNTNPEVSEWFPPGVPLRVINNGAGQVRALGRLAIYGNTRELLDLLYSRLRGIRSYEADREDNWEVESNDIVVSIVSSLAGGTGSGTFLDLANLIVASDLINAPDEIYGYLLLPDAFVGKPGTDRVQPNGYAALKELDAAMSRAAGHSFKFGGTLHRVERPPFNFLFLVNNTNVNNATFTQLQDVLEFIGTAMWVSSTATGRRARDLWDNIRMVIGAPELWNGKHPIYSSFGVSEMVFPKTWFKDIASCRGAISLAGQLADPGSDVANVNEQADRFIEVADLGSDEILLNVGDVVIPRLSAPAQPSLEQASNTIARRDSHVKTIERMVREEADAGAEELKETALAGLARAEDFALQGDKVSVPKVLCLMERVLSRLRELKEVAANDRSAAEADRKNATESSAKLGQSLEQASKQRLRKGHAIAKVVAGAIALARSECNSIQQYHRADKSLAVYEYLIGITEAERNRLSRLFETLTAVLRELNASLRDKLRERRQEKPFLIELRPEGMVNSDVPLRLSDFLVFLRTAGVRLTAGPGGGEEETLVSKSTAELRDYLLTYAAGTEQLEGLGSKSIEDVLRELPEESVRDYIARLYAAAAPLWQYDRGLVAGGRITHPFCIFAVPDAQNTMIRDEVVRAAMGGDREYPVESVNDPTRIICFKVEASLPAFVIYGIARYKDKYLTTEMAPGAVTTHVSADLRNLPDLYPADIELSRVSTWALALALPNGWTGGSPDTGNLVFNSGHHYYVRSQVRGDKVSGTVRLALGRAEAYREFAKDDDLVAEIAKEIDAIVTRQGKTRVVATVQSYIQRLRLEASKIGEEALRQIVERELEALDKWVRTESAVL